MKSNAEEPLNQPIFYILVFRLPARSSSVSKKPSRSRYSNFWRGANDSLNPPPELQMGMSKGIQETGMLVEFEIFLHKL